MRAQHRICFRIKFEIFFLHFKYSCWFSFLGKCSIKSKICGNKIRTSAMMVKTRVSTTTSHFVVHNYSSSSVSHSTVVTALVVFTKI